MSDPTSRSSMSPPSNSESEAAKETLKVDAERARAAAEEEAKKLGERAESEADDALTQAGSEVDDLTGAIDAAADSLSDADRDGLANYARQLSDQLSTLATDLQEKSASDLASGAQKLAKENPTGFLLGSIALGFGLSRFAKASSTRAGAEDTTRNDPSPATSPSTPPTRTPL